MNVQNTIVVNSNFGGLSFYEDNTGKYVVGADSVPKKLGDIVTRIVSGEYNNINVSNADRSIFIDIPSVPGYEYLMCAIQSIYCRNSNSALGDIQMEIEKYSDTKIRVYASKGNWPAGGVSASATVIIFYH